MKRSAIITAALGSAGLIAGLATGIGIASASIPDNNGVIHGCYKAQPNGSPSSLGVIDTGLSGGRCPSNQKAVTWNQTGPQGPQGPAGPPGADGSQVSVYLSFGPHVVIHPGQVDGGTAYCRAGDYATGGGGEINFGVSPPSLQASNLLLMESYGHGSGGATTGWTATYRNTAAVGSGDDETAVIYAYCIHGATLGTANG